MYAFDLFFNFFAKLFERRFLIVELYWGFQTSKFKVKYGSPSQADVRHGCVFWLWDNLDKYKVNHDLSLEKDVWTKSIVKTPYVCIIQPRSIAGLHHYTQQPISGIGKKMI